ncbi:hypothetical protein ALP44_02116 [Pseudomonas syringae pv. theae]|uniref:Uncharacterized protein n=2 Tax=Pseudomonas syringae TaxID=317 RepID=A0A3M5N7M4_PSESX|nr:hypothetical protein ALP44_02116 [Pseudomonas syringae pv. theae]
MLERNGQSLSSQRYTFKQELSDMTTPSAPNIPVPVVQGASAKNEISLGKDITLELPAISDPRCTFVILNLANADNSNRPLLTGSSPITPGKATLITLENTNSDPSMVFDSTHKAIITGTVQVQGLDIWPDTPKSEIYSFIQ